MTTLPPLPPLTPYEHFARAYGMKREQFDREWSRAQNWLRRHVGNVPHAPVFDAACMLMVESYTATPMEEQAYKFAAFNLIAPYYMQRHLK